MQGDPGGSGLLPVIAAHDDAQACYVAKAHPGQVDMDPASAIRGFGQGRGRDGSRDMAEDVSDFRASITELQAVLLGTESIDGFLRELASLAAGELGEGLSCGITLQPNGRPMTVASSDANAAQIDELQYGLDHGPCLTSMRHGEPVRIGDLASDQRWGDYAVRALAHGVRSSPSMPLAAQGRTVGALNLYSDRPHFFHRHHRPPPAAPPLAADRK